jgi:hypothetical protein
MRTVIYPPSGVLGLGHYRTVGVIARPLTPLDAADLVEDLAVLGIPVRVEVDQVIHLHALAPVTTSQEVTALRATAARSDARIAWHAAVADV